MEILSVLEDHGVSKNQVAQLEAHLKSANEFVFSKDPGIDGALAWLENNLEKYLPTQFAKTLYSIALKNKPSSDVSYLEQGYDSCQSQRKVAKVVGEAILLGGIIHEYQILGIPLELDGAKALINSNLAIGTEEKSVLPVTAKEYGSSQDFIFPGVTPSSEDTPSLNTLALKALLGKPATTVRNLTGVGGVRYDKDWNYVTDFATFVALKIEEDKRYYPGIGLYYALLKLNPEDIPLIAGLKQKDIKLFQALISFCEGLKSIQEKKFQGVSVLCSAFLPNWSEMKNAQYTAGCDQLGIAEAFHSPAYDFSLLKGLLGRLSGSGVLDISELASLEKLEKKFGNLWSFNSTIHLPWTAELAGLSNDLIGKITNKVGDFAIRYGVGWSGKSVEVREYYYGRDRKFPFDVAGKVSYAVFTYLESDLFQGKADVVSLIPGSVFWNEIKKNGFMAAALTKLKEIK